MANIVGTSGNDNLVGTSSNDTLSGLAGNDVLDAGLGNDVMDGGAGNDRMIGGRSFLLVQDNDTLRGGLGNDTYVITAASDSIVENLNEGIDTVESSISYTLGANVENLTLFTSPIFVPFVGPNGTGNALNNIIRGNDGANTLNGLGGNDTLSGGAGNDSLFGGSGNDTLNGDDGADRLEGGFGDDVMNGGAGNDLLIGGTRPLLSFLTDNDSLRGGAGDDRYVISGAGDTIIETFNAGTDTVESSISITLSPNVENLQLTGAAISGTGNAQNNNIVGNGLNNTLLGGGGSDTLNGAEGVDRMEGGTGNDTYYSDGDLIVEAAASGIDTVITTAGREELTANVENLIAREGFTTETLIGNALSNRISGNSQHNFIDGLAGNDHIQGDGGDDSIDGGDGNDVIDGWEGVDVLEGGNGNDRLLLDTNDFSVGRLGSGVDGGAGIDTLAFDESAPRGQAALLDLSNVDVVAWLRSIEIIDMTAAGSNVVYAEAADVLRISDTDDLRIDGTASDEFNSAFQGWRFVGNSVIGANTYEHYSLGAADLFVDTDIGGFIF
jgi:Ca2+-binding RTX toxin-like protein